MKKSKSVIFPELVNGILAGLAISLGGSVYIICENKIVGAILFAVALLTICLFSFSLYTGKIGYVVNDHSKENILKVIACLIGNFIGCLLFGILASKTNVKYIEMANIMTQNKLNETLLIALTKAYFCGVLMYIAVNMYKEKNTIAGILICVPVFIIAGFEHSIANMFYIAVAGKLLTFEAIKYTIIVVIGNALGGMTIPFLVKIRG